MPGIAVFALSGALVAAAKRQTLVTFVFFAVITGVGGGTVRDLLIGAPVFWIGRELHFPHLHRRGPDRVVAAAAHLAGQRPALARRDRPYRLCDLRSRQGYSLWRGAPAGHRHGAC
jgi:hypothetical protein